MPISIVLLTDTHALYKVNNIFYASPRSGFSFTRTRYIWRNDLPKRVWKKKIWQPLHWYGTPNERWIETDWILGTYIPVILDHCRTLYCVLLRFYRVRLFFCTYYILFCYFDLVSQTVYTSEYLECTPYYLVITTWYLVLRNIISHVWHYFVITTEYFVTTMYDLFLCTYDILFHYYSVRLIICTYDMLFCYYDYVSRL